MWIIACLSLLLFFTVLTAGDAAEAAPLWGRWGRSFTAEGGDASPDTQLTVELTAPGGKRHTVSGYWDGDKTWGVRFLPDEEGDWRYETRSEPPVKGLDGESGTFSCRRSSSASATHNPFLKHGPLRVSANKRYLQHADGTPFFWLGDTVWTGPQLSKTEDWTEYLNERAGKRFSVVQFNTLAPWRTALTDAEGETAFTGRENIRINPRYFRRLDARMDAINAQGMLAAPVLIWSLTDKDPGKYLSEDDIVRLVRYQIARYGAHHVLWILAGDNPYNEATTERWKRVGRAVFGGKDAHPAPVTTHPTGMNWPWASWANEEWLDVLGYQSGHGDDERALRFLHSGPPAQAWRTPPARPIINLEPPYEAHTSYQSKKPHTAYSIRRASYWSLLSTPPAGVTYGGHGVWSWHTAVGEPPTDHPGTGIAPTWREGLSLPGSADMKRLAELFTSLPWWTLRPAQEILAAQPSSDDPARFVAAARSEDGSVAVLYLPVGGEITLAPGVAAEKTHAQWFDPRTGQRKEASPTDSNRFAAPDTQDWVLLLRRP